MKQFQTFNQACKQKFGLAGLALTLTACGGGGSSSSGSEASNVENPLVNQVLSSGAIGEGQTSTTSNVQLAFEELEANQTGSSDSTFTLESTNFPTNLLVRFIPNIEANEDGNICTSAEGIIETDGQIGIIDKEIDYRGYADTSSGYRWDIDFSIDTDSGEVDGRFRYDPLGIRGELYGDAYFGGTSRRYESDYGSSDWGCAGVWQMTIRDLPFPTIAQSNMLTENPISESSTDDESVSNSMTPNESTSPELVTENQTEEVTEPSTNFNNTAVNETSNQQQTEEIGDSAADTSTQTVDASNTILTPFCSDAGDRIQQSVELGMTPEQVLQIVGKPIETSVSGTYWDYGRRSSTPEVRFTGTFTSGGLGPNIVSDYDSDTSGCGNEDQNFIEAANALAVESINYDATNETPSCVDAGLRIQAFVVYGMTPEEARQIVGKPIETSVSGTYWDYGRRSSTPEIRFTATTTQQGLVPLVVSDFDSDVSGCE